MSSDTITLKATERAELGKAVKALRRSGMVPANIYERGQTSQPISASLSEVTKVYHQAGKHHPIELVVGGKKHLAMIKDVDIDPVKGLIRHIAFHAINKNETVDAEIPVRIDGEIPAERISLMVLRTLDTVEVSALPANLPDELTIDGAKLAEIGDKVTVADITAPEGVTILTDPDHTVAVVEEPKDQIAAAAEEAAENAEEGTAAEVPAENGTVDADEKAAEKADSQE
jgi:large subunit ribosomal protein L25